MKKTSNKNGEARQKKRLEPNCGRAAAGAGAAAGAAAAARAAAAAAAAARTTPRNNVLKTY